MKNIDYKKKCIKYIRKLKKLQNQLKQTGGMDLDQSAMLEEPKFHQDFSEKIEEFYKNFNLIFEDIYKNHKDNLTLPDFLLYVDQIISDVSKAVVDAPIIASESPARKKLMDALFINYQDLEYKDLQMSFNNLLNILKTLIDYIIKSDKKFILSYIREFLESENAINKELLTKIMNSNRCNEEWERAWESVLNMIDSAIIYKRMHKRILDNGLYINLIDEKTMKDICNILLDGNIRIHYETLYDYKYSNIFSLCEDFKGIINYDIYNKSIFSKIIGDFLEKPEQSNYMKLVISELKYVKDGITECDLSNYRFLFEQEKYRPRLTVALQYNHIKLSQYIDEKALLVIYKNLFNESYNFILEYFKYILSPLSNDNNVLLSPLSNDNNVFIYIEDLFNLESYWLFKKVSSQDIERDHMDVVWNMYGRYLRKIKQIYENFIQTNFRSKYERYMEEFRDDKALGEENGRYYRPFTLDNMYELFTIDNSQEKKFWRISEGQPTIILDRLIIECVIDTLCDLIKKYLTLVNNRIYIDDRAEYDINLDKIIPELRRSLVKVLKAGWNKELEATPDDKATGMSPSIAPTVNLRSSTPAKSSMSPSIAPSVNLSDSTSMSPSVTNYKSPR